MKYIRTININLEHKTLYLNQKKLHLMFSFLSRKSHQSGFLPLYVGCFFNHRTYFIQRSKICKFALLHDKKGFGMRAW